jgi:hypothetical protein
MRARHRQRAAPFNYGSEVCLCLCVLRVEL